MKNIGRSAVVVTTMKVGILAAFALSVFAEVPGAGDTIALKALNGCYVSANNTNFSLIGNYFAHGDDYEKFLIENASGGFVALKCLGNGKYLSVNSATAFVTASAGTIGSWEKFTIVASTNVAGQIGFLSTGNTNYVIAKTSGDAPFKADTNSMGTYGSFAWEIVSTQRRPPYDFVGNISTNLTPKAIGNAASSDLLTRSNYWTSSHDLHYAEYYTANAALRFARVTENTNLFKQVFDRYNTPVYKWDDNKTSVTSMTNDNTLFMYSPTVPDDLQKHRTSVILLEWYKSTGNTNYYNKALTRSADTRTKMDAEPYPDIYLSTPNADSAFFNPFMEAEYYNLPVTASAEKTKCADRAARWLNAHANALQRADGLYIHNPKTAPDIIWGRGEGWCGMALAEGLTIIPTTHALQGKVYRAYLKFMDALLKCQQTDGMWYQVVDRTNDVSNWKESSGTAMICYCFTKGVKQGWLDPDVYVPAISNAWRALAARVDKNGELANVCRGINATNSVTYYYDPKKNDIGDFHGQATLIWLTGELIETRYNLWALQNGLLGTNAFMNADADGDLQSNFDEYFLGGDPTNAAVQGRAITHAMKNSGGTNWIEYVYPRRTNPDSGLSYRLELTDNLIGGVWTNAGYVEGDNGVLGDDVESVTNRIYISGEKTQQFLRLKIERK